MHSRWTRTTTVVSYSVGRLSQSLRRLLDRRLPRRTQSLRRRGRLVLVPGLVGDVSWVG
jgi:hypothetical protein